MACYCNVGQSLLEGHGSYSEEEANFLSELLVPQVGVLFNITTRVGSLRCAVLRPGPVCIQEDAVNPVHLFMRNSAESSGIQAAMSDTSTT